tara:strand:+ start:11996 stop:12574 length:579 start_codon:yes stop_codon:yes gene_type:complete
MFSQYKSLPGTDSINESAIAIISAGNTNPLVLLDPGLFIWTIITFIVLLTVLGKFAWGPLLKALDDRESKIRKSLDDADKARIELEQMSAESEEMISKARSDAQEIRVEAKNSAEKLKSEIKLQAENDAKKLHENAQKQIKVEKEKVISEIRKEVVALTVSISEKIIKRNLTTDDNKLFIEDSLKKLKEYEA